MRLKIRNQLNEETKDKLFSIVVYIAIISYYKLCYDYASWRGVVVGIVTYAIMMLLLSSEIDANEKERLLREKAEKEIEDNKKITKDLHQQLATYQREHGFGRCQKVKESEWK